MDSDLKKVNQRGTYHCDGALQALCAAIVDWRQRKGFATHWQNVPEKLMLVVTELSEAMEAFRHLKQPLLDVLTLGIDHSSREGYTASDEQKHYLENFKEELADAAIRLFDLAGSLGIDLEEEINMKMRKNEGRPPKHGKEC